MVIENSKHIEKVIVERFKTLGFKKKGYEYYKEWGRGVYAGISENSSSGYHVNCRRFGITVSILNEEVESVISKLTNRNRMIPTLSVQLGYLMPEKKFKEWEFLYGSSNDEIFGDMFNAVDTYAYPFWNKVSDINNLFNVFLNRDVTMSVSARETILPVLYYMRGEKDKGLQVIEEAFRRRQKKRGNKEIEEEPKNKDAYIIRAGETKPHEAEEWRQMLKEHNHIVLIGSGIGTVSHEYLDFKEKYMQLI